MRVSPRQIRKRRARAPPKNDAGPSLNALLDASSNSADLRDSSESGELQPCRSESCGLSMVELKRQDGAKPT